MQLTHAFFCRSVETSVFRTGVTGNRLLVYAYFASVILLVLGVYVPGIIPPHPFTLTSTATTKQTMNRIERPAGAGADGGLGLGEGGSCHRRPSLRRRVREDRPQKNHSQEKVSLCSSSLLFLLTFPLPPSPFPLPSSPSLCSQLTFS